MGAITLNLWLMLLGAIGGVAGAYVARGRNRMVKAAIGGAVAVYLATLIRNMI